ncbi:hypothetical protein DDV96_11810 [Marixanthomonas spongiae]|uniref:Uncharacterized protein n=1 Tax=Marixanthomonas spongiae TaxID=2174845 RepID=A0A2U0HY85_9FLAO|nr:hypothetical protein DDV96_11810 [Marixanthomonas spongiae]
MFKIRAIKIFFLIIVLQFFSCDRYDDCAMLLSPPQSVALVTIEDSKGNSLLGEDNVYKPSEITLTGNEDTLFLNFFKEMKKR